MVGNKEQERTDTRQAKSSANESLLFPVIQRQFNLADVLLHLVWQFMVSRRRVPLGTLE